MADSVCGSQRGIAWLIACVVPSEGVAWLIACVVPSEALHG